MSRRTDITRMLNAVGAGSASAASDLLPMVYEELRALAESYLRQERPGHTLQATALVHEAYIKLVKQEEVTWRNRAHFFAVAAQAIRRILVDYARGKKRVKRGEGCARIPLDDDLRTVATDELDLLALDEALGRLATLHERQARIVELRFFGGLSEEAVADYLGVSPRTVNGDWRMARAWLRRALAEPGTS